MVAIFLEELSELVKAYKLTTQYLVNDPQNVDFITDAKRQLHTIKGGARMTGLLAIGDLGCAGESLLNQVADKKVPVSTHLLEKLQHVSDELFNMYTLAVNGVDIEPSTGLIAELSLLSDNNASTYQEPDNTVSTDVEVNDNTETENQAEPASIDPMVAIYLEELSELVEAFDESTQKLVENSQDSDVITDAERQLHTIKGGARMTGLLAIGDLSHAGESLLNLVANEKVSADSNLLEKLQRVSDELFRMYELAANAIEIEPAAQLIAELKQLSGDDEAEEVDQGSVQNAPAPELEILENTDSDATDIDEINEAEAVTSAPLDPMVAIYLEELSELVEAFDESTQKLVENPQDSEAITEAERQLHTIKGGARMTGLLAISDLSHAGESLLNLVASDKVAADDSLLAKLQQVSDVLYKMYEGVLAGKTIQAADSLVAELYRLSGQESKGGLGDQATNSDEGNESNEGNVVLTEVEIQQPVTVELEEKQLVEANSEEVGYRLPDFEVVANKGSSELENALKAHAKELNSESLQSVISPSLTPITEEDKQGSSSIRVPTELINQLITSSNEWAHKNISLVEQYDESGKTIVELRRTAERLKEQIRNLELEADSSIHAGGSVESLPKLKGSFDPLEMDEYTELQQQSRPLTESMEDLMTLTETLELCLKSAEQISGEQDRTFKSVQTGLISTRMTKVTGLLSRLKRIVRQVSSELGKQVSVEIADENCEMDRTILERITASLEHLIRNSLAHGIEKPDERIKRGKSPQGKIVLKIDREGPEVVIMLQDDGAGIDVDKLRALSIKKGLIDEDTILSNKEVYQLILMSGVSTADKVSQVAGRGVGMDVVNAEVNALGGTIIIDSEFGNFTRFELRVPYNLATNQLMFLDVSGELLAVPVAKLEGMQRIALSELNVAYTRKNSILECGGRSYQLRHLGETLGLVSHRMDGDEDKTVPVILFEENEQRIAYQVDEIRGNREVMLKPLGSLFEQSKLLSSVAITGGGQIVLVLNAHELISLAANRKAMHHRKAPVITPKEKKKVMVVDDSITVRKITESLLLSLGYSVITANDGVNALEVLADEMPDLMLLDIEMPRMDGFELLENIRGSELWKELPVIMISSRSGAKHRKYANELGAHGFIGKPWEAKQLATDIKACFDKTEKEVVV